MPASAPSSPVLDLLAAAAPIQGRPFRRAEHCTPPGWRVAESGHAPCPAGRPYWLVLHGLLQCGCGRRDCDQDAPVDVRLDGATEAEAHAEAIRFMLAYARIGGRA